MSGAVALIPARLDNTPYDWRKDSSYINKNLLTWRLLREGYTPENHPETVQWDGFKQFNYFRCKEKMYWRTMCGLYVLGSHVFDMGYYGVDWSPENGNPICNCPYDDFDCRRRPPIFIPEPTSHFNHCVCRPSASYDPDRSLEAVCEKRELDIAAAKADYACRFPKLCPSYVVYDARAKKCTYRFDINFCRSCSNAVSGCAMFGETEDKTKGNVFYDIRETRANDRDPTIDSTVSDTITTVTKGKRYFDKPMPMNLCRRIARYFSGDVVRKEQRRHHRDLYFAENHGQLYELEVFNIRAERRESRDLMQDLADINEGLEVVHDNDAIAEAKKKKQERREVARESKRRRFLADVENSKARDYIIKKALAGRIKWVDAEDVRDALKKAKDKHNKIPEPDEYEQITIA